MATDKAIYIRKSQAQFTPVKPEEVRAGKPTTDPSQKKKKSNKKDTTDELKKELDMTEHLEDIHTLLDNYHSNAEKVYNLIFF